MTAGLFDPPEPLAARLRPRVLDEFVGQEELLAPGRPLGDAIRRGDVGSIILWGPPGTGKTSLAYLIARHTDRHFAPLSAVTDGVARVREIVAQAEAARRLGRGTILFCDEIHRFHRGQQDAFLPHVERGLLTLIGATTEHPSFALNDALLSRTQVYALAPLTPPQVVLLLRRALTDPDRGIPGGASLQVDEDALALLAEVSDGDARRALTALETVVKQTGGARIDAAGVQTALATRMPRYDRAGEEHFNLLSAYHKSLRGSDPDGALYWMARMLDAGEDPLVLFRRAAAMAAEDVGLADPNALLLAVAAREAYQQLGPPEGFLPLAELTIYLATAPKSNAVVRALHAALDRARRHPAAPVPLHLRNAPTPLHAAAGYGAGYVYPHDAPGGVAAQAYLPEEAAGPPLYVPGTVGFEQKIAERIAWWAGRRDAQAGAREASSEP